MECPASPRQRLERASKKAVETVTRFANVEPEGNNDSNPWKHPEVIQKELAVARNELDNAWKDLQREELERANHQEQDQDHHAADEVSEDEFRVLYMDMITDAFGDVLEHLQGGGNDDSVDVDVLVDCLQSGIELLDPDQRNRRSFFDSLNVDDDAMDTTTSVHTAKQRSLGYLVSGGGDE
jgi:hypothetical protein